MPSVRTIINLIIFTASVVLVIFGVRWYDGYKKARESDDSINITKYIKNDLNDIKTGMETIPDLLGDAASSGDMMKKSYADKMAAALEMYAEDKGEYPRDITDLVPEYINEKALGQKDFYYKKKWDGYEMGIKLGNGEYYTITN